MRERLRAVADRLPPRVRRRLVRWVRRAQAGRPQVSAVVLLDRPGRACPGHARRRTRAAGGHPRDPAGRDGPAPAAPGRRGRRGGLASPAGSGAPTTGQTTGHVPGSWAAPPPGHRWLLFLSPRQLLLPGAVETLMAARGTDPTVVLGELEGSAAPWSRTPLLGRLLVPHELWARTVDDGEPDGQTAAVSLLAEGFSAAGSPTLRDDPHRAPGSSRRSTNPMPALSARVSADRSMLTDLEGHADLRRARAAGALAVTFPGSCWRSSAATSPSGISCGPTPLSWPAPQGERTGCPRRSRTGQRPGWPRRTAGRR